MSKGMNCYVFSIFDCCRSSPPAGDTFRGAGALQSAIDEAEMDFDSSFAKQNYVAIYGCAPSDGVRARSTVAGHLLGHLFKNLDSENKVTIPDALVKWKGSDGKAELNP